MNPVPEKSDEMKHKIQIFNDLSPRGVSPRKVTPTFYEDEEIRAGKVSEIVASFSSIPKTAKIDIDPKEWITSRYLFNSILTQGFKVFSLCNLWDLKKL